MVCRSHGCGRIGAVRRGYTLVEMLIVVLLLGIASAMVIPQIAGSQSLRVQAVVRSMVADITAAQSEAMARQQGRVVLFSVAGNSYSIFQVRNGTFDPVADLLQTVQLRPDGTSGLVGRIESVSIDGGNTLTFDELGGPVTAPGSQTASQGGSVRVSGPGGALFDIRVEPFTGRVIVQRLGD